MSKLLAQASDVKFLGCHVQLEQATHDQIEQAFEHDKKPLEKGYDPYHPRSSRTLYVGNLENRVNEHTLKVGSRDLPTSLLRFILYFSSTQEVPLSALTDT